MKFLVFLFFIIVIVIHEAMTAKCLPIPVRQLIEGGLGVLGSAREPP
jgi:hypothetical protein